MNTQYQKVAVVTGASQGLGASIVDAYRKLGYAVVATSRTITPSGDPGILTVQGDIADPATAERVIAAGVAEECGLILARELKSRSQTEKNTGEDGDGDGEDEDIEIERDDGFVRD